MFNERQSLSEAGLNNEMIKGNIFVNNFKNKKKIMNVSAINLDSNIFQTLLHTSF